MGPRLLLVLAVFTAALGLAGTALGGRIPGQYIVVVKAGYDGRAVARDHARLAGADVLYTYRTALNGYAARLTPAGLAAVRADRRVAFVSADRTVHALTQTLPTGVNRIQGDASSTISGNGSGTVGTAVAVIDTGIDTSHPDLNVVGGKNCSTGQSYRDGNGHGTHVAGTIAAKDDGSGVVGMAPGAPLYAVRVLNNSGSGSWSSVICGVNWVTANAASNGIRVANMSLGGSGSDGSCASSTLHQAICNSVAAGVTYVVAAGNSNANFSSFVPAAYDQVLTVTAIADFNGAPGGGSAATCRADVDDTAADFSNFTTSGSADANHTIAAPGVCILSTWKGGGYSTISGTSMASPHVAGTAALCIWSGACTGTPSQIITKLRSDAAAQPASYGFAGVSGRYYGSLVYAGGY
ncbi:MAG TPA: S8 family serine peptidase [Gaiellaceae bacterium]|nr:S8 family serine peptidase [Gaiellaceae bacterium]